MGDINTVYHVLCSFVIREAVYSTYNKNRNSTRLQAGPLAGLQKGAHHPGVVAAGRLF